MQQSLLLALSEWLLEEQAEKMGPLSANLLKAAFLRLSFVLVWVLQFLSVALSWYLGLFFCQHLPSLFYSQ